jgi:hypothetical protein
VELFLVFDYFEFTAPLLDVVRTAAGCGAFI